MLMSLKYFLTSCIGSPLRLLSGQVWRLSIPQKIVVEPSSCHNQLVPMLQICPVWHLHTKLQGPGEQSGRIARVQGNWKEWKEPPLPCPLAAPTFTPSLPHPLMVALGLCLPPSWPGISTATPWQVKKPAGLPQDPSPPSDSLLLSLHALQTLLMAWTLQRQEPVFSAP